MFSKDMDEKVLPSRSQRRKGQPLSPKKKHKTGWMWHLPLVLILLGGAMTGVYIWHKKDQEKVAVFDTAQQQLIKQQKQANFQCIKDNQRNLTTVTYQPSNEKFTKELPLIHKQYQNMKEAFLKKTPMHAGTTWIQKIEKQVLNPKMNKLILSSQFFTWNKTKEKFDEQPLQQSALLLSSETGQLPNAKQIIGNEENLVSLKPIIQQTILEQAKAPEQIIDQVLKLPNLSFDQKITLENNQLTLELPQAIAEIKNVSIPLNLVLPYIDQNYLTNPTPEQTSALDPNKKYIALTFDDGPKAATTNQLLDVLAAQQVKATFFMLGSRANQYPDMVKRIVNEGHEVGSHSNVHDNLRSMSAEAIQADIQAADKAIFLAGGKLPLILRPPYGAINTQGAQVIDKAIIQWNTDSLDWKLKNTPLIIQHVMQTVQPGAILLMHDIYPTTVAAVGPIIEQLKAQGYEFVTVDQLLNHQEKPRIQYFSQNDARAV